MLTGKGMYIHKLKNVEGGDPQKAAEEAVRMGFSHVIIKVLDGVWKYNQREVKDQYGNFVGWKDDYIQPFIAAFKKVNIAVWGYQWIYLEYPTQEAEAAKTRAIDLGLDGMSLDVEYSCKSKDLQTKTYLAALEGISVPTALSSYRYPTYHPEISWNRWVPAADICMPQVYWIQAHNAGEQLQRCADEYAAMGVDTIFPTGAAFAEHGWVANASDIVEFASTALQMELPGINFWEWAHTRAIPSLWEAVGNIEYPSETEPIPPEAVLVDDFVIDQVYPFMLSLGYKGPKPVKEAKG